MYVEWGHGLGVILHGVIDASSVTIHFTQPTSLMMQKTAAGVMRQT